MFNNNQSGFSFGSISLAGMQAASVGNVLKPGRYVCKVIDAELKKTNDQTGDILKVKLKADAGSITANLNVNNKSAEATRIGLEQLKGLLVFGGHPDPDNIGQHGVASIKGLTVGVVVGSEKYNGQDRSKVIGFCKPEDVPQAGGTAPAPAGTIGVANGKIPF